ncbi:fluoride efflux transporter CrcB [soil metagenome]
MSAGLIWLQMLAVAAGSVIGGLSRWATGLWLNSPSQPFPYGTLAVNCVGGLLIGGCLAWFARVPSETLRLFLVTGCLGGLTTFSSFSAESLTLLQRGEFGTAIAHTAAHVLGALACAAVGYRVVSGLVSGLAS